MTRYFLATAALVGVVGCSGSTQELPVSSTGTTTAVIAAASIEPNEHERHAIPTPEDTFTDDQILGLLATFNTDQIDLDTVAQERTKDAGVKKLAGTFQKDHTMAREQEARLSERLVMRVATTDKMRAMEIATGQEVEKLKSLSGHALDVEYVDHQVAEQRDALAMIDLQLIPSARISEIRAHLASLRETVDHHLRDAENMKRSLGGPIVASK